LADWRQWCRRWRRYNCFTPYRHTFWFVQINPFPFIIHNYCWCVNFSVLFIYDLFISKYDHSSIFWFEIDTVILHSKSAKLWIQASMFFLSYWI
jgi:hypothetical protein